MGLPDLVAVHIGAGDTDHGGFQRADGLGAGAEEFRGDGEGIAVGDVPQQACRRPFVGVGRGGPVRSRTTRSRAMSE
ncbi:hypothetical protein [Streptomyces sp. 2A115]|uniref:hypothetical protein n=1 Tax=Streptomyces sp. 2A115 TaxID=3457439 RepID=UPI003FD351EB